MEDKIKEILNKFYNIEEEGLDSIDFENYAGTHYSNSVKITTISQKTTIKLRLNMCIMNQPQQLMHMV